MPTNKPEVVLPEQDLSKNKNEQGLFRKYEVRRTDGSDFPGGKHDGCDYFVLDMTHDPHAKAAAAAYADSAEMDYPDLTADMRARYGLDTLTRPADGEFHECQHCKSWSRTNAQQPAEAVAADEAWADFAGVYLGDDEGEATLDAVRLCRMAFDAGQRVSSPPAIDIGKLRELVARLKSMAAGERERAKHHSVPARDAQAMHGLARILDGIVKELAALIGDGGEKGNG